MIGSFSQAIYSDRRIYDDRKASHGTVVDRDEIKRRYKSKGLKQVDLANALNIDPVKVSKSLDKNHTRTFTDEEMLILQQLLREEGDQVELDGRAYPSLPVIGQVQAGNWSEAVQRPIADMPALTRTPPRNAFGLDVVGDSMDKLCEEGTRIIVDPDDKALYPNKYYVVINARGETTFKRFHADPARLVPCSTNPAYKDIILGGEEPFTIVGRVIWRAAAM